MPREIITIQMEPWEEALDLDDSDLPSLLRPCKRLNHHHHHHHHQTNHHNHNNTSHYQHSILQPNFSNLSRSPLTSTTPSQTVHSQQRSQKPSQFEPTPQTKNSTSPRLIPGPAGAVLAAMLRKDRANRNPTSGGDNSPIPTQEYLRRAVERGEQDHDFNQNPWLRALQFLDRQAMVEGWLPSTPLNSIKKCLNIGRLDLVAAVIKSCTSNGFGDLMVTLKDPTGSICANIHRKVLAEAEFGKEISVGSVLILQKVAVFAPSRSAHYLNVTLSNVVKVISKDNGPLLKQNNPVSAIKPVVLVNECSREMDNLHKTLSLEVCSSSNGTSRKDQHDTVGNEPLLVRQDAAKEIINRAVRIDIVDEEQRGLEDVNKLQNGGYSSSRLEHGSPAAAKLIENQKDQEIWRTNGVEKQRQPLISRASLPEWTDEQLNELFSTDCVEDGFLF